MTESSTTTADAPTKKERQHFTLAERLARMSPERFAEALREHQAEGETFSAERDRRKAAAAAL